MSLLSFFLRILKTNESSQPTLHKGRLTSWQNASYMGSRAATGCAVSLGGTAPQVKG